MPSGKPGGNAARPDRDIGIDLAGDLAYLACCERPKKEWVIRDGCGETERSGIHPGRWDQQVFRGIPDGLLRPQFFGSGKTATPTFTEGGMIMGGFDQHGTGPVERVKRGLMIWCALILFMLGVWLLIEPARAQGMEKGDNVVAAGAYISSAAIEPGGST